MNKKQRIKFLRESIAKLEITQLSLAAVMGLTQPDISNMLSGARMIRPIHLLSVECLLRRAGVVKGRTPGFKS